jgi:hypothetical protein
LGKPLGKASVVPEIAAKEGDAVPLGTDVQADAFSWYNIKLFARSLLHLWIFCINMQKILDCRAPLCSLQGIKIHLYEFLYNFALKRNKLLVTAETRLLPSIKVPFIFSLRGVIFFTGAGFKAHPQNQRFEGAGLPPAGSEAAPEERLMSDTDNLYQSPQTDVNAANPLAPTGRLTETMVSYLKGASPWLRFLGVLGFISAGGTILGGVVFLIGGILGSGAFSQLLTSQLDGGEIGDAGIVSGITIFTGALIIAAGAVYFFPARFIYNFGQRIRTFLQNNAERELELAFKNNKSLWKFIGIMAIISLAFLPVMLIVSIIAVIGSAL